MTSFKSVGIDHPGTFIKIELEEREWTQRDLAFILGQTEQQLNPLLSGKRAITPDMARLLGDAFGVPAQFFANLQSQYDLANAKEPDPAVRTRAELQTAYPVRDMIRRGWIRSAESSLLQLQVDRFFEAANDPDGTPTVAFAAKKTHYDAVSPHQLAWVFRVRQLARHIKAPEFSIDKLRLALPKLRSLMIDPEAVRYVPEILKSCGVRLVIVETLPGAKIDGVCTWLDDQSPVIGMSTLYDRLDNFWFVLRHEIEHILLGHGKSGFGIVDHLSGEGQSVGESVTEEERLANFAASQFCIPHEKMDSFYARKNPYFSERDVIGFAATMQIHPAIVVGQLQRRMNRYDFLRKYQTPVRRYIVESATTDGWGNVAEAEL
ncbi:MAG: helix-turn-helix domain-containing protein [Bosea sp.]|uniref:helix-turn-helix domain-containing protein n=1 Tax=Bosea sp. (in: a-proteobacteria) TaxID=1871050 RepID=UPI001AC46A5C|nr:helix-turn-helix domain-containing protein [Bosea sp. (in: a-proteobacteria)]MBN9468270.1 helix-turn-helix domain-containing protein [Bosea sp. (in: a-proteobacteria)]